MSMHAMPTAPKLRDDADTGSRSLRGQGHKRDVNLAGEHVLRQPSESPR